MDRRWQLAFLLLLAAVFAVPAFAQQPAAPASAAPAAAPTAPAKPKPKPKPAIKPAPKPATAAEKPAPAPAKPAAIGGVQPKLLGQYADWGAYTASPGGKKVYAIAKPASSQTNPPNRPRNSRLACSSPPGRRTRLANEVSIIIGYPFKPGSESSAQIGLNDLRAVHPTGWRLDQKRSRGSANGRCGCGGAIHT